jgi:arginine decarboxylase
VIEGSTVGSVLTMTQWDQPELIRLVKAQVDAAIKSDRMKPSEAMRLLSEYERGLKGYTYLNFQNGARDKVG